MLYISSSVKIICKIAQNNEPLLNHSELLSKTIAFVPADSFIPYDAFPTQTHPNRVSKAYHACRKKLRNQYTSLQSRSVRYQFKACAQTCENFCAVSLSYISLPSTCVLYKIHGYKDLSVHFCLHREQILDFD